MKQLQTWMDRNGETDETLAKKTGLSRPHISKLRRGKRSAGTDAAIKLQKITGIPWHKFVSVGLPDDGRRAA
jgi:transcriptional regulator with XRE-family HTH domain